MNAPGLDRTPGFLRATAPADLAEIARRRSPPPRARSPAYIRRGPIAGALGAEVGVNSDGDATKQLDLLRRRRLRAGPARRLGAGARLRGARRRDAAQAGRQVPGRARPARRLLQHRDQHHHRHGVLGARRAAVARSRRRRLSCSQATRSAPPASRSTARRPTFAVHDGRGRRTSRRSIPPASASTSPTSTSACPRRATSSRSTCRTRATGRSRCAPMSTTC